MNIGRAGLSLQPSSLMVLCPRHQQCHFLPSKTARSAWGHSSCREKGTDLHFRIIPPCAVPLQTSCTSPFRYWEVLQGVPKTFSSPGEQPQLLSLPVSRSWFKLAFPSTRVACCLFGTAVFLLKYLTTGTAYTRHWQLCHHWNSLWFVSALT